LDLALDDAGVAALVGDPDETRLATARVIEELKSAPESADQALEHLASLENDTNGSLARALLVSARQQIVRIGLGSGRYAVRAGDNDVWLGLVDDVLRSANSSHPTAAIDARSDLTIFLKAHPERRGEALDRLKKAQIDPISSISTKAGIQMAIRSIKDSVADLSPQVEIDDGMELEPPGGPR
jgi:hypothetical protein